MFALFLQAIVVLIRPTFVRRAILANSILKAGVSTIFSFKTLEHLLEVYKADTYKSPNVTLTRFPESAESGLVKTAWLSVNM